MYYSALIRCNSTQRWQDEVSFRSSHHQDDYTTSTDMLHKKTEKTLQKENPKSVVVQ
jgi:hypothetical protein